MITCNVRYKAMQIKHLGMHLFTFTNIEDQTVKIQSIIKSNSNAFFLKNHLHHSLLHSMVLFIAILQAIIADRIVTTSRVYVACAIS